MSKPDLWQHQSQTKAFYKPKAIGLDTSDPGTGKTRSHLEVFAERPERGRLLVVCPKTLMKSAWGNDIEAFTSQLTYSLAYAGKREQAFGLKTDVVIINHDGIKELVDNPQWLKGFTDIIIDEITAFKHRTSQRTKAAFWLRRKFERRFGLTGTPNPVSVTELWAPMYILDDGRRLGAAFGAFRNATQTYKQIGPGVHHIKWEDMPGSQMAVASLLKDVVIRHDFEEVMSHVPPNHRHVKRFDLARKARTVYDTLEDEAVALLGEQVVSAVHKAALRTKLLQVASGAVYDSDGGYVLIDRTRYELVAELIEPVAHSLVFFNWKHQRDELAKEFESQDIRFAVIDGDTSQRERDRIVADFQAGKYKTLLMHPATGAHGLTLTRGTMTVIVSPFDRADFLKQVIHRVYRGTQDQITNTVLIEANDTIEKHVYDQLNGKYGRMLDLLDLMKLRKGDMRATK